MTDPLLPTALSIIDLVAALPEKYQPIFGHPELSGDSARDCAERLQLILRVSDHLEAALGRPVRVLDLGCAQGFFSLSLAVRGCTVYGVDFLERNIAVCQALAREQGLENTVFAHGRIEEVIACLKDNEYDLVLGLSVFHHLVHEHGTDAVADLIGGIASRIPVAIYEMAVRDEPLYWADAQPQEPADLLRDYALTKLTSFQKTHLSDIVRPIFYASNRYWMIGDDFREFTSWRSLSHAHASSSHMGTRRYYFGEGVMLKRMSLLNPLLEAPNRTEFEREMNFLCSPPPGIRVPRFIAHEVDGRDVWLLREQLPGKLLSELMAEGASFSGVSVADQLIGQLVALESAGLYHNDVRCWNLLVGESGGVSLIDYGAISKEPRDCVWPDNLILSLLITLREIFDQDISVPDPVRNPLLDVASLPSRYRDAFRIVLDLPQAQWSFSALQGALGKPCGEVHQGWELLASKQEGAAQIYQRTLLNLRDGGLNLQARLNESLSNAHHWFLRASDYQEQLAVAEMRVKREADLQIAVAEQMQVIEMLQADVQEARAITEAHRVEAIRQSMAAQAARAALAEIVESTSWRMTSLLRHSLTSVRRFYRSPGDFARGYMVRVIQSLSATPRLWRLTNRFLKLFPSLHSRLRAFVSRRGLLVPSAEPISPVFGGLGQVGSFGSVGNESASALSARGEHILERVRSAARVKEAE